MISKPIDEAINHDFIPSEPTARNIFSFSDYRSVLLWLLEVQSKVSRGQKAKLALAMGCQPAYLSRVLSFEADLSMEQIELATRHFVLDKLESEYLISLLGHERSGTPNLKNFWKEKLEKIKSDKIHLSKRLQTNISISKEDQSHYYQSYLAVAVHTAVTVPALQTPQSIANYLNISEERIKKTLQFLCQIGVVKKDQDRFISTQFSMHLDKDSPLATMNHVNWRIKAVEAVSQPIATDVHYTSVVSMSREDVQVLKEAMFEAILKIRNTVKESKEEIIVCYTMDLFEVGQREGGNK